ncbi:hypothetical protein X474_07555 [Dethiosulfatarculus sandiegensis]|uniref:Uncharacterized protein n=1 Tax=Dethiosulfatarculus sandiegensis TaxID=1429043 RepID=A0A0D2GIH0_9BACT|nr:hypothetical protein X474_07555 [Dethiosulfatarculus sandiegensis]
MGRVNLFGMHCGLGENFRVKKELAFNQWIRAWFWRHLPRANVLKIRAQAI